MKNKKNEILFLFLVKSILASKATTSLYKQLIIECQFNVLTNSLSG